MRPGLAAARRVLGLAGLLLWALVAGIGGAQAHAVLLGTEPQDGAIVAEPPSEVVVRFNEPVSPTRVQVLDPEGQEVSTPEAVRSGEDGLHLLLPTELARGTYTVSYHVVSLDGHPIAGSLVFSLGSVSGGASGVVAADETEVWRWTFVAAHVALYLGLFGAAGGVAYLRLARPVAAAQLATRRIVSMSALLGLAAAVATLGLQGGLLLGGSPRLLLDPATWATGIGSTYGRTAICDLVALGLIWAGSRAQRSRKANYLSLAGVLLALAGFALSGHVMTAGPRWLTMPPLLLHAAAAAFWVGSLVPLHRALTGSPQAAGRLIQRFSNWAVWAVVGLVAAGLVLAWLQVRHPEALVTTEYGRVLLVKLALVAGLLGLATLNRLRLTPALVRGDAGAPRRLGWSILGEVGLVVGVLTATAALGTTPPPRALQSEVPLDPGDMHVHKEHGHVHAERVLQLQGKGFEATAVLRPGQVGASRATVSLVDPEGQPLEVSEVSLRFSNPSRGIAPLERSAQPQGPGTWEIGDIVLGVPGEWTIELDVLISDFERQTASVAVDVP